MRLRFLLLSAVSLLAACGSDTGSNNPNANNGNNNPDLGDVGNGCVVPPSEGVSGSNNCPGNANGNGSPSNKGNSLTLNDAGDDGGSAVVDAGTTPGDAGGADVGAGDDAALNVGDAAGDDGGTVVVVADAGSGDDGSASSPDAGSPSSDAGNACDPTVDCVCCLGQVNGGDCSAVCQVNAPDAGTATDSGTGAGDDAGSPGNDAGTDGDDGGSSSSPDAGSPLSDAGAGDDGGQVSEDGGSDAGRRCVLTFGYWMNHPNAWPVSSLTLGSSSYSETTCISLLEAMPQNDASLILVHQLIAAVLNSGTTDPNVSATVSAAQTWMSQNGTTLPYHVAVASTSGQVAVSLAATLNAYNNGQLGTKSCD